MATIKVIAGDFLIKSGEFNGRQFVLKTEAKHSRGETIELSELAEVEVASEESVKKIGGTLGWGTVGAVALGPVGLLAGLMLGGRKKEVTFAAKFRDGRRLLATTDNATYMKLRAAVF